MKIILKIYGFGWATREKCQIEIKMKLRWLTWLSWSAGAPFVATMAYTIGILQIFTLNFRYTNN